MTSITVYPVGLTSCHALALTSGVHNGRVHSVYERTVNITAESIPLIALQSEGSPLSPLSFITKLSAADMANLGIRAGNKVMIDDGCIVIEGSLGPKTFSATGPGTKIADLSIADGIDIEESDILKLKQNIFSALLMSDAKSFDLLFTAPGTACDIPFLAAAGSRIDSAKAFLGEGEVIKAASELSRLIGLGIGLTPGGDDFLSGAIAALYLLRLADRPFGSALRAYVEAGLGGTHLISASLIRCALTGEVSYAAKTLTNLKESSDIYEAFSLIGHSSGVDMLSGIYYILDNYALIAG